LGPRALEVKVIGDMIRPAGLAVKEFFGGYPGEKLRSCAHKGGKEAAYEDEGRDA